MPMLKFNDRKKKIKNVEFYHDKIISNENCTIDSKEGLTATKLGNVVFFIGGMDSNDFLTIPIFNHERQIFSEFKTKDSTGPWPRYGHTAIKTQTRIIIFGGEGVTGATRTKFLFNEIWTLNPSLKEWKKLSNGHTFIEGRKNHATCLLGNYMISSGGEYETGSRNDQLLAYNLKIQNWEGVRHRIRSWERISHHTMDAIFDKPNYHQVHLYKRENKRKNPLAHNSKKMSPVKNLNNLFRFFYKESIFLVDFEVMIKYLEIL